MLVYFYIQLLVLLGHVFKQLQFEINSLGNTGNCQIDTSFSTNFIHIQYNHHRQHHLETCKNNVPILILIV